jgi:hypothetical protein
MSNCNSSSSGSSIFPALLAVAFIVLKLTGVINWSWLWVLAPLWIPLVILVVCGVFMLIVLNRADRLTR